jgi:hypothetical protein
MWQYATKVAITAVLIVAISEIAKRSSFWAAVLASLPLTSILVFMWLYIETGNIDRVATLSLSIFWLVLPSLVMFLLLPLMLRAGWPFYLSLASSTIATAAAYVFMVSLLSRAGIILHDVNSL